MLDPQFLVFLIIGLVFLALWKDWLPAELAALSGFAILLAAGIIPMDRATSIFANPALATVACMFVLSAALEFTGVIDEIGRWFSRVAGDQEWRALLLIMGIPLVLSPFINNTPIVVVLMPVVLAYCRSSGIKPTRLLIPLSFAAILGGTCSLIGTSTNLLVDGLARRHDQPAFSLFEIAPLGLIYAGAGVAYMLLIGRRFLPYGDTISSLLTPELRRNFLLQAVVTESSPLIGKTIIQSRLASHTNILVMEIKRRGVTLSERLDQTLLQAGDRVLLRAGTRDVTSLRSERGLSFGLGEELGLEPLEQRSAILVEAILGPNSALVGQSLIEAQFREIHGVLIMAMHRDGEELKTGFEELPLQFGDVLLMEGEPGRIEALLDSGQFISLSEPAVKAPRRRLAPIALGAIGGFIVLGAMGIDAFLLALIGAILVTITGCVKPEEAYAAIEWRILFLIAGMLGIAEGLEATHAAENLAHGVVALMEPLGPLVILSAIYLFTSILTEVISNNAVAILLTPIAIDLAEKLGSDPRAFLVAIMFGASASFATPIGYQTNTYVYAAGGYAFRDFLKVGLPLNLILWIVATLCIPLFWPL